MTDEISRAGPATPELCLPRHLAAKTRYTTPESSEYLFAQFGVRRSIATLNKLRTIGGGPTFHKFGANVLYDRAALDQWVEAKLSGPKSSTAA